MMFWQPAWSSWSTSIHIKVLNTLLLWKLQWLFLSHLNGIFYNHSTLNTYNLLDEYYFDWNVMDVGLHSHIAKIHILELKVCYLSDSFQQFPSHICRFWNTPRISANVFEYISMMWFNFKLFTLDSFLLEKDFPPLFPEGYLSSLSFHFPNRWCAKNKIWNSPSVKSKLELRHLHQNILTPLTFACLRRVVLFVVRITVRLFFKRMLIIAFSKKFDKF